MAVATKYRHMIRSIAELVHQEPPCLGPRQCSKGSLVMIKIQIPQNIFEYRTGVEGVSSTVGRIRRPVRRCIHSVQHAFSFLAGNGRYCHNNQQYRIRYTAARHHGKTLILVSTERIGI